MQLLQITVTPMKYELEIEHGRLEIDQDPIPKADVQTTPTKLHIDSKPAQLQLDSYRARQSLGFEKVGDRIHLAAEKGQASLSEYVRKSVDMGNQMSEIQDGITIGQIINQRMLEQPVMYTAFLPSGGMDISWIPNEMHMQFQTGSVNYNWQIKDAALSYIPGSVRMRITQYPSIDIQYMGSPIYVPPSSKPA